MQIFLPTFIKVLFLIANKCVTFLMTNLNFSHKSLILKQKSLIHVCLKLKYSFEKFKAKENP